MGNTNYRNKKRIKGKMNEEKCTGKINKLAFWPAVIALIAFIVAGIVDCQGVGNVMSKILNAIADYFGAYINILSLVFLILAAVIIIGKYGGVPCLFAQGSEQDYYFGRSENLSFIICRHQQRLVSHRQEQRVSLR